MALKRLSLVYVPKLLFLKLATDFLACAHSPFLCIPLFEGEKNPGKHPYYGTVNLGLSLAQACLLPGVGWHSHLALC